jgi:serine/threonine-protein kinase
LSAPEAAISYDEYLRVLLSIGRRYACREVFVLSMDEGSAQAQARVGTVLKGKYRLERVLGIGGMAAVYAATHLRNANRVAVKILHPELAREQSVRERFLREGYAANSVGHPGTVRILDDDTADDGTVFFVMELLDGETLDARWERKGCRLPHEEVSQLLYQVLDVLAAAHARGIVHRDIKPENLFYTRDRKVKVLDFGVARLLEGSVKATRTGGLLGTPAYMAPEQVLGKTKEIDAQSDLWAVGASAFTLLSGHFVHDAETAEEMMVYTGSRQARSIATLVPDLPPPLVRVVDRALAFRKADRWSDARAMQKAIEEAYSAPAGRTAQGGAAAPSDARVLSKVPDGVQAEVLESGDVEPAVDTLQGRDAPDAQAPAPKQSTIAGVTAPTSESIARSYGATPPGVAP